MSKANEQWKLLCYAAGKFAVNGKSQPEAFSEACRRFPELAAQAVNSDGQPALTSKTGHAPSGLDFEARMQSREVAQSPLVLEAQRMAAALKP